MPIFVKIHTTRYRKKSEAQILGLIFFVKVAMLKNVKKNSPRHGNACKRYPTTAHRCVRTCTRLRASECSIKQTEELFKPCKVDLETPCRAFLIIKISVKG
jgi:hypothetical protein